MLDKNMKELQTLKNIKEVMVETMLNRYTGKELSKSTLSKFVRYMDKQQKRNGSKNSVDNRIGSLYKAIQKEYESFVELNDLLSELD